MTKNQLGRRQSLFMIASNKQEIEREKVKFNRLADLISAKYRPKFALKIYKAMIKQAKNHRQGLNIDIKEHQKELRALILQLYSNAVEASSKRQFQNIKKNFQAEFEIKNDAQERFEFFALDWIIAEAAKKARNISQTTEKMIKQVIKRGQEENLSTREVSKIIEDRAANISKPRAMMIANTESFAALSFAKQASTKFMSEDIELPLQKFWASVDDSRTRPWHAAVNNQRRDMDESYIVGGEAMMRPHDSTASGRNVINCRCTETYRRKKEANIYV